MVPSHTPDLSPLLPRQEVPALALSVTGGGAFDLAAERPQHFTLIVFYRGLHCPICTIQLRELEAKLPELVKRGVGVIAISSDTQERAERAHASLGRRSCGRKPTCAIDECTAY